MVFTRFASEQKKSNGARRSPQGEATFAVDEREATFERRARNDDALPTKSELHRCRVRLDEPRRFIRGQGGGRHGSPGASRIRGGKENGTSSPRFVFLGLARIPCRGGARASTENVASATKPNRFRLGSPISGHGRAVRARRSALARDGIPRKRESGDWTGGREPETDGRCSRPRAGEPVPNPS